MQENLKSEHVDFYDIKRNLEKKTKTFAGELCLPNKCTQQEYNAITQEINDRKFQKRMQDVPSKFQQHEGDFEEFETFDPRTKKWKKTKTKVREFASCDELHVASKVERETNLKKPE